VDLLRERVLAPAIDASPAEGTDWAASIARRMRSYRMALAEQPNLIPLLTEHTMTASPALSDYDRVAALLRHAGVSPRAN
jgi:Tetracyclin repressor-like, C-terminal domain